MIGKILVALDSSSRAEEVFDAAVELAERFGARVCVFRAVDVPPEFPASAAGSTRDLLPEHLASLARAEMNAITARAPGLQVDMRIDASSEPGRAILSAGDDLDVDLIVIGSHGYGGLDRFLGTTAAKVVNLARRSVLVVHEKAAEAPTKRPSRSLRLV